jgi:hypothetical protein
MTTKVGGIGFLLYFAKSTIVICTQMYRTTSDCTSYCLSQLTRVRKGSCCVLVAQKQKFGVVHCCCAAGNFMGVSLIYIDAIIMVTSRP